MKPGHNILDSWCNIDGGIEQKIKVLNANNKDMVDFLGNQSRFRGVYRTHDRQMNHHSIAVLKSTV